MLELANLSVAVRHGPTLVDNLSLTLAPGETLGLVGESGSGKSMTAHAILGLFPSPAIHIAAGTIRLDGTDLATIPPEPRRRLRGSRIGMVFQDPSSFLDPMLTAGAHIAETFRAHGITAGLAPRIAAALARVDLPPALAARFPHELSGGQRQRVLIAAALALNPALLIADEPTTALDVTVQAGILALLRRESKTRGLATLLITHDLGVVAETCDRVAVIYAGRLVETAPIRTLFATPRHPYTQGLLASVLNPENPAPPFAMPGGVPPPNAMPEGCRFRPRCPLASAQCATQPPMRDGLACWHPKPDAWAP